MEGTARARVPAATWAVIPNDQPGLARQVDLLTNALCSSRSDEQGAEDEILNRKPDGIEKCYVLGGGPTGLGACYHVAELSLDIALSQESVGDCAPDMLHGEIAGAYEPENAAVRSGKTARRHGACCGGPLPGDKRSIDDGLARARVARHKKNDRTVPWRLGRWIVRNVGQELDR